MNAGIKKGRDLARQGLFTEAESVFRELARAHPNDPAPLWELVYLAREQKSYPRMLEYLERILSLAPDFLEARILRRRLLAMRGEMAGLLGELDTFFALSEKGPLTHAAAVQLFRAIQYCCTGSDRVLRLRTLLRLVRNTEARETAKPLPFRVLSAEILLALGDYAEFSEIVNELSRSQFRSRKIDQLRRISEKCMAPDFPDFSAEKVFGIGLSRTGTSSLTDALSRLGYHAIHWFNPHSLTLISQSDFCLFDAFADIPASCQFEFLYHSFPNARFVYTTRPIPSWETSITHHYEMTHGISSPAELRAPRLAHRFDFAAGRVESNLYSRFPTWSEAYRSFDLRVNRFFEDKPTSKLLKLGICSGEGWEKLCPFLEKPIPPDAFPNSNPSPPGPGSPAS